MTFSELYALRSGAILEAIAKGDNYKTGDRAFLRIEDELHFKSFCLYKDKEFKEFLGYLNRPKWTMIENGLTADQRYKLKLKATRKNGNQAN